MSEIEVFGAPPLKPFFEVIVGNPAGEHRHYKIYANGLTEGFEDGDKSIFIINRIRQMQTNSIALTAEDEARILEIMGATKICGIA